jgi:SAM-dependent methyltransferase
MAMADAGESVHGEVDLVMSLLAEHEFGDSPRVLDAGCGTGRVAIELAARGVDVAGGTEAAGLALVDRWSTWDRAPFANGDYVVSAHRRI